LPSLPRRPGHELLRCPLCRSELTAAAGGFACRNRHRFDLAREGYVNLLPGNRRRPAMGGDGSLQLSHRAAFLDTGHFDGIAAMIAEHIRQRAANAGSQRVLDAGCGTGHHLAGVAAALPLPVIGLGLDISRDAARLAARRWSLLAFAVADLWTEWPVQDQAVDLVLSVFAPKNFPEAARVLRPGGWLALAYPGPCHLIELRRRFGLLRQHEDRTRRYGEMTARFIGAPSIVPLLGRVVLDGPAIRNAILMGPNARHLVGPMPEIAEPMDATFDINIIFARKS